jgi:hypothetical protein
MPSFNIVFSCAFEIDVYNIRYTLDSKSFAGDFTDDKIVTWQLVEKIVCCKKALEFIVERLADDKEVELYTNFTPEEGFNGLIKNIIEEYIDDIKTILEENGSDSESEVWEEESESSDESE